MQITDPISNPRLFIEQTRSDALQQLRPGQVVRAVVEVPADKGIAQLNIGGIKIPVKTGMKLEIGQQLALDVVKAGNIPEFKVVREVTSASTQVLALKSILPKQLPLNQLLDALRSLTTIQQAPVTTSGAAPAVIKNSLDTLFQQLIQQTTSALPGASAGSSPLERNLQLIANALQTNQGQSVQGNIEKSPTTELARQIGQLINQTLSNGQPITGAVVRQALNQSGLFMEPHLLNGQPVQNDLKGILLKLLATLQPMLTTAHLLGDPPVGRAADTATALQLIAARLFAELHHQAEGALARIQLHQLASLPQDENSHKQLWQFELPISHPEGHDEFLIQFEKETRPAEQAEDHWSVTLNFNIPPTGPVRARLSLIADEISSHFTAELDEGVKRIEQFLPTLNEAFSRAGLKVGKLSASQGSAVKRPDQPISPSPLLDERA